MSVEGTSKFFYSTMLPAIGLIPIWFAHGRYWMMGHNNWVATDEELGRRALPGMILFHIILWWWESPRKERPVPEVALGLWAVYILQFFFQVFYVNTDDDDAASHDGNAHSKSWSVATKYFHSSINTTISNRIALGLAIDIWVIMGVTLFVSFWTPDHQPRTIRGLIQQQMTYTVGPAVIFAPIWFVVGHMTLGSGCQAWDWNISSLVIQALFTVMPFHIWLWHREEERITDRREPLPEAMAIALLAYYGLQLVCQLFIHDSDGNFVEHYLHIPQAFVTKVAWTLKALILVHMITILRLSYYYGEGEEGDVTTDDQPASPNDAENVVAASPVDDSAEQPTAIDATPQDELREPLLAAADREASREESATPDGTADAV